MAPQSKSHGLGKSDFTQLFKAKSTEWLNKVLQETKDPSTAALVEEEDRLETVSALPEHYIHGFENQISFLENFLLDQKVYDQFRSFVVLGEYGVGKTALCQMIFNDKNVKSVYAPKIWVSMHSKETNQGEDKKIYVLKRILEGVGVEDDLLESIKTEAEDEERIFDLDAVKEKELSALLYAVNLNLKWKKYLIVFDDVRGEDNWDENVGMDEEQLEGMKWGTHLSDGFPKGSGGRVIYTTREPTLAKKLVAEEHEMLCLLPLSDTEAVRKIYEEAIKKNNRRTWRIELHDKPHPGNEKKCLEELMNKSGGLPLAARMMAWSDPVIENNNLSPKGPTDTANNPVLEKR